MPLKLNLMVDEAADPDSFEFILEEKNKDTPATLYVKGPYMGANVINRNGRLYPIDELRKEVNRYVNECVKNDRALGELNHPASADVDLERACHMVVELTESDNVFIGKSKVLSTPMGMIVRNLINDDVKIGMSSRALGTLEEKSDHNVVHNLKLCAIDCVSDPSFSDAWVNGILESKQFIIDKNGSAEVFYDRLDNSLKRLPSKEREKHIREAVLLFINSL